MWGVTIVVVIRSLELDIVYTLFTMAYGGWGWGSHSWHQEESYPAEPKIAFSDVEH